MGALVPFAYGDALVRVIEIDGGPWFVAGDVARLLGFREAYHMVRMLDDDEQLPHIVGGFEGNRLVEREATIISESGLYHAVLKSRRPDAKVFRKWVTSEVIPSIRRTGSYRLPAPVPALPDPRAEELDELRQRVPSEKEAARGDLRAMALAHVEQRIAEGLTKTAAVAEAAVLVERCTATVWNWCNIVRMVPESDRAAALTPWFRGGGRLAPIHPEAWQLLTSKVSRSGAHIGRAIREVEAVAARKGWAPIPHPQTLRRRIAAMRGLPTGSTRQTRMISA